LARYPTWPRDIGKGFRLLVRLRPTIRSFPRQLKHFESFLRRALDRNARGISLAGKLPSVSREDYSRLVREMTAKIFSFPFVASFD
jgi:hypothetical protein